MAFGKRVREGVAACGLSAPARVGGGKAWPALRTRHCPLAALARSGLLLAEALVGLAVALLLVAGLCTMLQQWRRGAASLERRAVLLEAATRAMRAAAREDFEALRSGPLASGTLTVTPTGDADVVAVRVEIVEKPLRVVLERLVARPEASLSMEGKR